MSHINYTRRILEHKKQNIQTIIEPNNYQSFSALMGTESQRDLVLLHSIAPFCEKMGIVILHNRSHFNDGVLSTLFNLYPNIRHNANFDMKIANDSIGRYYDPLYGLDVPEILRAIIPPLTDRVSENRLRNILRYYLQIMEYNFRINPQPFGDYAYNLDMLFDITKMSATELYDEVLRYMPGGETINEVLSAPMAQQDIHNMVSGFCDTCFESLWKPLNFGAHTRTSIFSTVSHKQLISIYVPNSSSSSLDYLAIEIQKTIDLDIPILIVNAGVNLNQSTKMQSFFLENHKDRNYYTGICANSLSEIKETTHLDDLKGVLTALTEQSNNLFIFNCPDSVAAEPYVSLLGEYHHREVANTKHNEYTPFKLIPHFGHANAEQIAIQNAVEAAELTSLKDGCFLVGSNYSVPIKINTLTYTG